MCVLCIVHKVCKAAVRRLTQLPTSLKCIFMEASTHTIEHMHTCAWLVNLINPYSFLYRAGPGESVWTVTVLSTVGLTVGLSVTVAIAVLVLWSRRKRTLYTELK